MAKMSARQQQDLLLRKVLEIDAELKNLKNEFPTREEYREDHDKILQILDRHTVMLQRLDQERISTTSWIRRIKNEVRDNTKDIKTIKAKLALS